MDFVSSGRCVGGERAEGSPVSLGREEDVTIQSAEKDGCIVYSYRKIQSQAEESMRKVELASNADV